MAAVEEPIAFEPIEEIDFKPISEEIDFQGLPEDSGQSRTASAVNRFLQTIQSDTGAMTSGLARASIGTQQILDAATARQIAMQGAMAGEEIPDVLPRSTPASRAAAAEKNPPFQAGQRIQQSAREVFPTNPRFSDSGLEAVASGLGSVVSLAPATLAGPAAPLVAGASYGLNAGEQAISEAGQIIDGRIAEAMAEGDFDTAEDLSKDKTRLQENAGIKNAVIGAVTEGALGVAGRVIPLGKGRTLGKTFDKTIEKAIPKSIGPVARAATKSAAEGAVREGVQETTEQIAQNMAAWEYDPNRDVMEGVGMAGGAGAGVGAIVGAGAGGLGRLNRRLKARERLMNRQTDQRETVADTPDPNDAEQAADVQEALGSLPLAAVALKELEANAPAAETPKAPVGEEAPLIGPDGIFRTPLKGDGSAEANADKALFKSQILALPDETIIITDPDVTGQVRQIRKTTVAGKPWLEDATTGGLIWTEGMNNGAFSELAGGIIKQPTAPKPAPILSARPEEAKAATTEAASPEVTPTPPAVVPTPAAEAPLVEGDVFKLKRETYFHGTREVIEGALKTGSGKDTKRFLHEEGIWFAPNAGKDFDSSGISDATRYSGDGGTIVEAKLSLKNPYRGDVNEIISDRINAKWLRDNGYDGFVDDFSGSGFVAVLDPSQITEVSRRKLNKEAPNELTEPSSTIPSPVDDVLSSPAGVTETKRRYKPRAPEDRPRDIIDDYEENDGRKISITEARRLISDFKPTGAAKDLFSNDPEAIHPDEAAKSVPKQPIDEDFLRQLQGAAEVRIGQREAKRTETRQLDTMGEAQLVTEDFNAEASKPKEGEKGRSVEGLYKGSEFELDGEKMRVKELHFDPESGELAYVEIEDGRRFGTQTRGADQMIFPDKGTFKENAPSTDFAPEEPFGLEPAESVPEQKARLAAEKAKAKVKAEKEKIDDLASDPLKGTSGDLGQGDLLADPTDLWAPKKPKPRAGQYAIDPATQTQTRPNLFDPSLTDEEIAAFFDPDPAPGRPGEARPTSRLSFATYEEFRDWMNARFAENDLDGMTDGIKDSSSAFKVRYIKETRGGDPNLRDVLSHLATVSPLPAGWAPAARTTPRPNPPSMGGSRPTATTPPPSRPAGPPPPPRTPTPYERFSIPALVQLHRLFGKYPRINRALKSAYGHFKGGEVGLKQRLLWDKELATRVLSHEIGHFIDLAIEKFGKGRQFANRWQPLRSFMKKIAEKENIRRAAIALSQAWRGPFTAADKYRNSPSELFADAMSAILTKPQWVSDNFPIIHDTFHGLLTGKPAFKTAYDQVTAWLQGDELAAVASGQMRSGFQESRRKLAEGEKRMLGKPIDWLKQLFVDPWFRVADIEGYPRELGKRGLDILGALRALPARMNALMKDDFLKNVQPFLDKIQGGGGKARDIFAEFLVANRVINERRAAGQWIEQNPDDAHKLLEEILKNHAGLRSKWGGEFAALGSNPTGTQLYDFAAAIFREVHDGGEAMVKSVADTIDDLKLGVSGDAALLAFNVRGKLLNPSGIDVNEAQNILNRIDSALTPTERADLNQAARGFYDIAHGTMEMAHDMGLISDKAWNEIVLPNRYNYVPFAVAEYWDGHVGAAMKPQYGTAKDVIDPVIALQQKLSSMHRWIQRQAQVQALIQVYTNGGHTVTPTKRLQQASDIHKERAKERNGDTSMLVLWKNGQPYLVEFKDDPMHSFETAMEKPFAAADFARMWYSSQLGFIPEASGWMLALYTTLSPSFFLFRNPIRDVKTTAQHIGYSRTARAANQIQEIGRLGKNYAQAGYGKPMDPEVRALVEKGVLPPPRSHNLITNSPEELEQLMLRGRVMASEIALYRNSRRHGRLAKAMQPILEKADVITGTFEAASKIIAYRAAKLKPGISEEKAIALAKRSGIPMPGIQGTSSWLVEMVLPWTRVHIQGMRSTFDIAKDPEMGKEFMARVAMFELAPRLAKYLFASGLAGMVLGGGDDEDAQDGVAGTFGEFFRRASPYKIAVDDLIPLAWFDTRTGEYHPLSDTFAMKAKNIPKHWEAVSFRPPSSEEGKLWGSLFYGILAGTTPKQTGRGGQGVGGNAMDWITSQGVTGENPAGKAAVNALRMEFSGNQRDDFRGRPLANEDLYNAGGIQKQQAILGATLNQGGDAGKLVAMVLESFGLPPEATKPTASTFSGRVKSALSGNPALSYDNYAQFRDSKVAKDAEERSRAQIRLLMSPEVREMYDFLNKNRSKVKTLDARDARLYQAALDWHRDVYGSSMQEGTIVNRALAAVEKDGSIKAKETLRRDLAEKSAVYLKVFQAGK